MSRSSSNPLLRRVVWFLLPTVFAGGCDLSTKGWAEQALGGRPGASLTVVDPWLDFSLAYNRGTAFSLIRDLETARWVLAGLAVVVAFVLLIAAVRSRPFRRGPAVALGTMAGGALGNGYDRAFRVTPAGDTGVVDFIRVNLTPTYSWPTFNMADVWLALGLIALGWWSWHRRGQPPP